VEETDLISSQDMIQYLNLDTIYLEDALLQNNEYKIPNLIYPKVTVSHAYRPKNNDDNLSEDSHLGQLSYLDFIQVLH
jgi:hypothetical protein